MVTADAAGGCTDAVPSPPAGRAGFMSGEALCVCAASAAVAAASACISCLAPPGPPSAPPPANMVASAATAFASMRSAALDSDGVFDVAGGAKVAAITGLGPLSAGAAPALPPWLASDAGRGGAGAMGADDERSFVLTDTVSASACWESAAATATPTTTGSELMWTGCETAPRVSAAGRVGSVCGPANWACDTGAVTGSAPANVAEAAHAKGPVVTGAAVAGSPGTTGSAPPGAETFLRGPLAASGLPAGGPTAGPDPFGPGPPPGGDGIFAPPATAVPAGPRGPPGGGVIFKLNDVSPGSFPGTLGTAEAGAFAAGLAVPEGLTTAVESVTTTVVPAAAVSVDVTG